MHIKLGYIYQIRFWKSALFVCSIYSISQSSCTKYLEAKSLKTDAVPNTIKDLQALLSNEELLNNVSPMLTEILADNYYLTSQTWNSLASKPTSQSVAQNYRWDKDAIPFSDSWIAVYQNPIYISNLVLDYLPAIKLANNLEKGKADELRGAALFYRANAYFEISQLYCKPYNQETASNDLGLAIKLSSDINEKLTRISVQESYDFIIRSLRESVNLLPTKSLYASDPSKVAAYGVLARTFLCMRKYDSALYYSNAAIEAHPELIDFNQLVPVGAPPVPSFNAEVIFNCIAKPSTTILSSSSAKIDSVLINSYDNNDLRKTVFFRPNTGSQTGTYAFRGSFHGSLSNQRIFTGIATGELYLIRAECLARKGETEKAMADLNSLMEKRWKSSEWTPIIANSADEALEKVLSERRKELVFRGQRWSDLRRFNLDGANITLRREIDGVEYILPPNDPRWVTLIPFDVITRSGIAQNTR